LIAATLIVPALAYADREHFRGNDRDTDEHHEGSCDRDGPISAVPEANAGWVLVPFVGAVLVFSWRKFAGANT
jgi:hypothetical protein